MSVRLRLALSYAGFLTVAGVLLVAVVWVFLLRYVPDEAIRLPARRAMDGSPAGSPGGLGLFIPGRYDLWRAFAPKAAVALAALLVLGLVGGWFLAGRMLAPLNRITAATRAAGGGSLSHRIRLPGRSDEFRELADAFDGMLAQIEDHVAEQRRFAANASHELRTPLAIAQTLIEVARNDPDRDVDELLRRLQAVTSRAIDLTEALLLLSRADQGTFTRERVDLSLLAEEATETLLPFAERRGLTIETSGVVAPTVGSPALLLQLTTNLVHNAIVHNAPGHGDPGHGDRGHNGPQHGGHGHGAVWVTTSADPQVVTLTVENTGEVLAPELVSTLAEPFRRGTERVRSGHAGTGLGLAIATSIARAHHGSLSLAPRAGGGLCVTVRLPAAGPEASGTGKS